MSSLSRLIAALTFLCGITSITAQSQTQWSLACDRVCFESAPGNEQAMMRSRIEGSNTSRVDGLTTLAAITQAPEAKAWTEVKFANKTVYRWLRFIGPRGTPGKLGKVEFYAGDTLLAGDSKGINHHLIVNDVQAEQSVGYDAVQVVRRPMVASNPEPVYFEAVAVTTAFPALAALTSIGAPSGASLNGVPPG